MYAIDLCILWINDAYCICYRLVMHRNNAIKQWCIIAIISMYDVCSYLLNTLCVINLLCILQLLQSVTVVHGDIHWWCMLSIHNASCTFYQFKMHADIANDWYCYSSYDVYSTSMTMLSINHAYTAWYRLIMLTYMTSITYACMLSC